MKKIEVHFFSERTEKAKTIRFSWLRLLWWMIGAAMAIGAFFWFSPLEMWDRITNGHILELYEQNKQLQETVTSLKRSTRSAEAEVDRSAILLDSALQRGGVILSKDHDGERRPHRRSSSFTETYETFRSLRDSLLADPGRAAAIPILHPLKHHNNVTNRFGLVYDHFTDQVLPHRGVDFVVDEGDTVIAPGDGVVSEVQSHRGFGLCMKITHTDHVRTFYAHLDRVLVRANASVKRGQPIALVGESGRTSGPVLHYEVRLDGQAINPEDYFITR